MKYRMFALILTVVMAGFTAYAQQPPMPEVMKLIYRFDGTWFSPTAEMKMGRKTYKFAYTVAFRKISDGAGMFMEEKGDIPGLGNLRGSNLIGFDPFEGKVHWFSVDNLGTTHDHIAEAIDKNHLRLTHTSSREGKTYKEVIDLTFKSSDRVEFSQVATLDGKPDSEISGSFKKK